MENQIKQSRKQNWFQKQFSSRNSRENLPKEGAYEAAVAAAAFAIQSVEEAKTTKLKSESWKESGRNVENSKEKPMKQKTKELQKVNSAIKPSSKTAAIPIAPGDHIEWFDKLKSVVACGSDKMMTTNY
ncbi:hypothetical protein REPUB_Repub07fG0050200 [Reevesia pubescens]